MTLYYGTIALVVALTEGIIVYLWRGASGLVMSITTAPLAGSLAVVVAAAMHIFVPSLFVKRKHRHNTQSAQADTTESKRFQ